MDGDPVPWIGLLALVAMFVIPFLPDWLFEGSRTVRHWPRRHVCGACGADWTSGHVCEAATRSRCFRPDNGGMRLPTRSRRFRPDPDDSPLSSGVWTDDTGIGPGGGGLSSGGLSWAYKSRHPRRPRLLTVAPDHRDLPARGPPVRREVGFLTGTLPFIREGVAAGEPVLVVVSAARIGLLRAALGGDADRVAFADWPTSGPTRPGSSPPGAISWP